MKTGAAHHFVVVGLRSLCFSTDDDDIIVQLLRPVIAKPRQRRIITYIHAELTIIAPIPSKA